MLIRENKSSRKIKSQNVYYEAVYIYFFTMLINIFFQLTIP